MTAKQHRKEAEVYKQNGDLWTKSTDAIMRQWGRDAWLSAMMHNRIAEEKEAGITNAKRCKIMSAWYSGISKPSEIAAATKLPLEMVTLIVCRNQVTAEKNQNFIKTIT